MMIFDEEKYAIDIIKNGFKDKNIFKDVTKVAKYLRYKNEDDKYIYKLLHDLCREYKKDYNEINDDDIITKITKSSKKLTLKIGKNIDITKSEFDAIKNEDEKIRKVLFVMLVISKFEKKDSQEDFYFALTDNEIFKLAKVNVRKSKRDEIMYYLTNNGFINPTINKSCKVLFANENSESLINFKVDDNMCIYLDILLGKKTMHCEVCDKIILKTNNRIKYCKDCYKVVHIEQIKQSVKRQRSLK